MIQTSKYNFIYRDTIATPREVVVYKAGDALSEPAGLVGSFLRGGLISGCNLRFLITLEIGNILSWADTEYRNRGAYIFDLEFRFLILDVYKIGDYYQVLITPDSLTVEMKTEVIAAARADFNQLIDKRPVQILDTPEWRYKVKKLVGDKHKKLKHKSIFSS
ncbi:MAG: hypothetical protein JWN28_184 [Candidatus Saccharibacteria bacterium]|nr:hypothetical protein [Candidatus Saccharibacteria bacterium]